VIGIRLVGLWPPAANLFAPSAAPRQGACRRSLPVDAHQPIRNTALGQVEFPFLRKQPPNLVTGVDGKTGAEELIAKVIRDDALFEPRATTRLPGRLACCFRVEGLAVSPRLAPKLPSREP